MVLLLAEQKHRAHVMHHTLAATGSVPAIRVTVPYVHREICNTFLAMDLFIDGEQVNSVAVSEKPDGTVHLDGIGQAVALFVAKTSELKCSAPALVDAVNTACRWSALKGVRA